MGASNVMMIVEESMGMQEVILQITLEDAFKRVLSELLCPRCNKYAGLNSFTTPVGCVAYLFQCKHCFDNQDQGLLWPAFPSSSSRQLWLDKSFDDMARAQGVKRTCTEIYNERIGY